MRSWCGILSAGDFTSPRSSRGELQASILRLGGLAGGVDAQPPGGREPLLRQEAALVVHLPRALDPVAEIDVRQAEPARARDVIENHKGAERAACFRWLEERVDHRQTVAQHVR